MRKKTVKKQPTTKTALAKPKRPAITYVPEQIPTVYVNHAQFIASIYDAGIILGEISGRAKDGALQVTPRAKVLMSHDFTREFASLLIRNLDALKGKDDDSDADSDADDSETGDEEIASVETEQ